MRHWVCVCMCLSVYVCVCVCVCVVGNVVQCVVICLYQPRMRGFIIHSHTHTQMLTHTHTRTHTHTLAHTHTHSHTHTHTRTHTHTLAHTLTPTHSGAVCVFQLPRAWLGSVAAIGTRVSESTPTSTHKAHWEVKRRVLFSNTHTHTHAQHMSCPPRCDQSCTHGTLLSASISCSRLLLT
jgi:hypothetical protein